MFAYNLKLATQGQSVGNIETGYNFRNKINQNVTLIGEPTGGYNTSVNVFDVYLGNEKVTIMISNSRKDTFNPFPEGTGICPDIYCAFPGGLEGRLKKFLNDERFFFL